MNPLERFLATESATFLLNMAWQTAVLLAATLLAERLARRHLTARHAILLAGLIAVLGIPAILVAQQKLGIALMTLPIRVSDPSVPEVGTTSTRPPIDELAESAPPALPMREATDPRLAKQDRALPTAPVSPGLQTNQAARTAEDRDASKSSNGPRIGVPQIAAATLCVWLVGSAICAWRLLTAWLALRAVRRRSRVAQSPLIDSGISLLREVWHGPLPQVRVSDRISTPLSAGVFQPCVLLPEHVIGLLSARQLQDVLLHETAHIHRRDPVVVLLQQLAKIVLWPNPLFHRLNWLLDVSREDICDNYVIAAGDAVTYSRTLLDLSQYAKTDRAARLAGCLLGGRRQLETRVRDLLDERRTTMTRLRPSLNVTIASLFLTLGIAVAAVRAQTPTNAAPPAGDPSGAPIASLPPEASKTVARGRVVDTQGQPLKNVKVVFQDLDREESLTTDASGHFQVPEDWGRSPLISMFSLLVRSENGAIGWYGMHDARSMDERIPPHFDVTVYPSSKVVRGTLVDQDGKPAAGVRLKVTALHNQRNGSVNDRRPLPEPALLMETVSNANGEYSLKIPEANGTVMVVDPRYTAKTLFARPDLDFTALGYATLSDVWSVRRKAPKTGVIALKAAGRIEGRVIDGRTGQPLAKVFVGCQALSRDDKTRGWREGVSGPDGRYRIEGLAPGVYDVVFRRQPGSYRIAAPNDGILVEAGKAATADLVAVESRRLTGRVIDADTDQPVAGIKIGYYGAAAPRSGALRLSADTGEKGEFILFVPSGPARVYIMNPDYAGPGPEENVLVPENQDAAPVLFRLSKSSGRPTPAIALPAEAKTRLAVQVARLRAQQSPHDDCVLGVVVDPAGKPIAGARIFNANQAADDYVTSDDKGEFVFPMKNGSRFALQVYRKGYHVWSEPLRGWVVTIVLEPKVSTSPHTPKK
jgi:beta-lactamase regulating signal transducer with metallopeptidase domain